MCCRIRTSSWQWGGDEVKQFVLNLPILTIHYIRQHSICIILKVHYIALYSMCKYTDSTLHTPIQLGIPLNSIRPDADSTLDTQHSILN